ncbi:MAG: hypothetical protein IPI90_05155 [Saprospiraceae bacterium]|nr:hypothetical protein [Candidatus Vicinibacter affinis]
MAQVANLRQQLEVSGTSCKLAPAKGDNDMAQVVNLRQQWYDVAQVANLRQKVDVAQVANLRQQRKKKNN